MGSSKKLLLFFFLLLSLEAHGQMILYSNDSLRAVRTEVDSSVVSYKSRWNAAGLVVGTNLAVWGFDRYVTNAEFSHIGLNTIKANFKRGFVWDNDFFQTNLFLHPYHGGLYFNAARTNGMSYWQSVPYSLGGSLMWECLMEKEYPSINDFIATSIGGTGFGEVTFRLSDRFIDERSFGWERVGREAATLLTSPVRGVNRILTGRAWKHERTRGNVLPPMPINGYLTLGYRYIYDKVKALDDKSSMASLGAGFSYGNPYDDENDRPYDYFSVQMYANMFSNQPFISRIRGIGMLYSDRVRFKKKNIDLSWGIYQHFNYLESRSDSSRVTLYPYKLSEAASIGPGVLYKRVLGKRTTFYASAYLSGILLGSSQSDHYRVYNRDYNLGSGFSTKFNMEWLINHQLTIRFFSEDYRIYTWLGADPATAGLQHGSTQGDRSNASLSIGALDVDYLLNEHLFIGVHTGYLYRKTEYLHYPTVKHEVSDNSASLGWLF